MADRLDFKYAEAELPGFMDRGPPHHVWEVYGQGVSMFVGTAMKDGRPDRYGNVPTTFNPNRLDIHVSKAGVWQRISFYEVLIVARETAREFGWTFTKAEPGKSCST